MKALVCLLAISVLVERTKAACVNGQPYYYGPSNRQICACDPGWAGPRCDDPATPDLNLECNAVGATSPQCPVGMQCAMLNTSANNLRCLCAINSTNPSCNPDNLTCQVLGCDPGLQCDPDSNVCVCAPFSTHPMCGCSGRFRPDPNSPTTISCTFGPDGDCVNALDATQKCYTIVPPASNPVPALVGPDLCDQGMQLNGLGQCICLPASPNPKCRSQTNNSTVAAANVCARFLPRCKKSYSFNYTVFRGRRAVATGSSVIDPRKNYIVLTKGIATRTTYELCVSPTRTTGWTFNSRKCTRSPAAFTCCINVTSSPGASNFSSGCAVFSDAYKGPATC